MNVFYSIMDSMYTDDEIYFYRFKDCRLLLIRYLVEVEELFPIDIAEKMGLSYNKTYRLIKKSMGSNKYKRCPGCNKIISIRAEFCHKCRDKKHYLENRDKILARNRHYQKTHKDLFRQASRERRKSGKSKEDGRKYRENNSEKIKIKDRNKRVENSIRNKLLELYNKNENKKCRDCKAILPKTHSNFGRCYSNADGLNNRCRRCAYRHKDDRRKRKSKDIFDRSNGICYYCGIKLDTKNFDVEHKIPISRDGTNSVDNLVASCIPCNRGDKHGKYTMTDIEYVEYRKNGGLKINPERLNG